MPLSLVAAPEKEPIELATALKQLRQTGPGPDQEEFLETNLIPAARERMEIATRRQGLTATYDLLLDDFPCASVIELPKPPLQGVTFIKYLDANGTLQTWDSSSYLVQTPAGPRCRRGRITPAYGQSWPSTRQQLGAVQIRFTCGYGLLGTTVPKLLVQGMLLDVGGLWEFREALIARGADAVEIPRGARDIYRSFKSRAKYPIEGVDE